MPSHESLRPFWFHPLYLILVLLVQSHVDAMSKPFRIAVLQKVFPKCTFHNPPCHVFGNTELIGLTEIIVHLLHPVGYNKSDIRFVPAMSYGARSGEIENSNSILGMVRDGNAEMSDYALSLTHSRDRNFLNTGPIHQVRSVFVYRRPQLGHAELNIFNVIPWRISLGFVILGILLKWTPLWFPSFKGIGNRSAAIFGLSLAFFFGYLSTKVVLLFNAKVKETELFTDFHSLAKQWANGNIRLTTANNIHYDSFTKLVGFRQKSPDLYNNLVQGQGKYPIRLVPTLGEALKYIPTFSSEPPYEVIITTGFALPTLRSKICNLNIVHDYFLSPHWHAVFFKKGLNFTALKSFEIKLINTVQRRLQNLQYEPLKCNSNIQFVEVRSDIVI